MLECVDTIEQEMLARLDRVRSKSKAPLIILTDNATLDWSLLALREGADAIFTMNTPDEIIFARSNALLRRWSVE
jgi:DNA-binding response OmpR family regulator